MTGVASRASITIFARLNARPLPLTARMSAVYCVVLVVSRPPSRAEAALSTPIASAIHATPVELADSGLLTAQPVPPAPRGMKLAMAAVAYDGGGAGSGTEFAPAELVVEASVEARFHAEPA